MTNKKDRISLKKTLMIISMQKINLIPHFFLEILPITESCNLTVQEQFGLYLENQNFADKGFEVKYKYNFSFYIVSRKNC